MLRHSVCCGKSHVRAWDKVLLLFWRYLDFPYNTLLDKLRNASVPKTSSICTVVSIEQRTHDRQRRDNNIAMITQVIMIYMCYHCFLFVCVITAVKTQWSRFMGSCHKLSKTGFLIRLALSQHHLRRESCLWLFLELSVSVDCIYSVLE